MSENTNGKLQVEERPSTEVVTRGARRRFTAEYKLRILREVDACKGTGEIGALLRREGLYSSTLSKWRQQRARGELERLAEQRRGPKEDPQAVENTRLKRENERLREELRKAQLIIVLGVVRSSLYCKRHEKIAAPGKLSQVSLSPRAWSLGKRQRFGKC